MIYFSKRRCFGGKDPKLFGSKRGTKIPGSFIDGQANDDRKIRLMACWMRMGFGEQRSRVSVGWQKSTFKGFSPLPTRVMWMRYLKR